VFDALGTKLQEVFRRLSGKGILTEQDVDAALREVRLALLEADVHFRVTREFLDRVKTRAIGAEVLRSLSPGHQVIKIVHEELVSLLAGGEPRLPQKGPPPTTVMLVGLQGSGKTTTSAKLALWLRRGGQRPLLVAADLRRPAAVEQLTVLGRQLDLPVYRDGARGAVELCATALAEARRGGYTHLLLDTAGRLHVDEEMMAEAEQIKRRVQPVEVLLVADAMTGQDAVRAAEAFHARLALTGIVLAKMDGDARGGAALSMKSVTGIPIRFIGTGEKPDALEPFHADRVASRILGMGDVLTLIEKAQDSFDQGQAKKLQKKMRDATFDLEDFLTQLRELRRMGPLEQVLGMLPGFSAMAKRLPKEAMDGAELKRMEAIICSMTPRERRDPDMVDGSRRRRIARGSGTTPQDINQLLNRFREARQLMKQMARGGPLPFGGRRRR